MRKKAIQTMAKSLGANSPDEMLDALEEEFRNGDSFLSYCLGCGEEGPSLEPDAANVKCESCGKALVTGLENVIMLLAMTHPSKLEELMREEAVNDA